MALSSLDQAKIDRIKQELRWHPAGMTISKLASKMKVNRNLLAKYLDTLLISGQVTIQITGTAKVYSLSQRIPVVEVLDFISEAVIVLDNDLQILQVNEPLLSLLQVEREVLVGKKIDTSGHPFLSGLPLPRLRHDLKSPADAVFEATGTIRNRMSKIRIKPLPVVFDNGSRGIVLVLEDITTRTDSPPLSEPSVIRIQGIVEDQTEFIVRFRLDGTLSFVSDSCCHYFQKEPDALLGRSVFSLLVMEDREQVEMRLRGLHPDHPACSLEHRVLGPSVMPRWHRWTYTALFDPEGNAREYLCVGRDITDKCETTEKINQYIADQAFLYWKSREFADLFGDANIYETIGRSVRELVPGAIVAVVSLKSTLSSHCLTTRCFLDDKARDVFSKHMGEEVVGSVLSFPDSIETAHVMQNLLGGKLVKVPGNLFITMMGQVPREACRKIEEELNIGDIYILGFVSQNTILGDICLMLRKGDTIRHNELLEIYIRQATLALKLRLAEEALKKQGITGIFGAPVPSGDRESGMDDGPPVYSDTRARH